MCVVIVVADVVIVVFAVIVAASAAVVAAAAAVVAAAAAAVAAVVAAVTVVAATAAMTVTADTATAAAAASAVAASDGRQTQKGRGVGGDARTAVEAKKQTGEGGRQEDPWKEENVGESNPGLECHSSSAYGGLPRSVQFQNEPIGIAQGVLYAWPSHSKGTCLCCHKRRSR